LRVRLVSRVSVICFVLLSMSAVNARLSAQSTTSVIGLVTDSLSGSFVAGAQITVVGTDLGTTTDGQGHFALRVPLGSRRLLVERPGYEDLEAVVEVTDPMGGLLLKLVPDARTSPDSVDVSGMVIDASSGAPIVGAEVSFGERGPRATTNPQGRFVVRSAPSGSRLVHVRRFGYKDLEGQIAVRIGMRDPVIELTPDPVQLEALTVTGDQLGNVRGRVVDALSEAPIPFANLTVTRDGFTRVGRVASSDPNGAFTVDDIKFGGYLLKVERLGYHPVYFGFAHPSPEGLTVRLDPSPAMLEGVEGVVKKFDTRRRSFAHESWLIDERRLKESLAAGMRTFLDQQGASFRVVLCKQPGYGMNCVEFSSQPGDVTLPRVYLDEIPQASPGLEVLASYDPKELYQVELYRCGPSVLEIHAYTYAYVERQAMRSRGLIPACL
jgi:hypothetical protein